MSREQQVLDFIDNFEGLNVYFPEIAATLDLHPTALSRIMVRHEVVKALEEKGHKIVAGRPKFIRKNYRLRKTLQALVTPTHVVSE